MPIRLALCLLLALPLAACSGSGDECTEHDHTACRDGELFWVDSCGVEGYRVKVCECGCNDGFTGCKYPCLECERTSDCTASHGPNYFCDLVLYECVCAPQCTGQCCGDDGCSGICPDNCPAGTSCSAGTCECVPEVLCTDGQTRCSGDVVQQCANEDWSDQEDCSASGQACLDGGCVCVPSGDEVCNGLDDDCDGLTDEAPALLFEPEHGLEASDGIDNNCNGLVDEPGGVMVEINGLSGRRAWIDVYEATVFENPDCTGNRYGAASDDYPAQWPMGGQGQIDLYGCSLAGHIPSGSLSALRAARACQAQGKRLCSRGEWILGCAADNSFYPWALVDLPPGACNDALSGPNAPAETGSFVQCIGEDNTYDMVGNLAEWLAGPHPDDPSMGVLAGGSYALTICLFDSCWDAVPDLEGDIRYLSELNDCIPGSTPVYGYPSDQGRQEFGTRCCLDGP